MIKTDVAVWIWLLCAGGALGVMFFGGLWLTLRYGLTTQRPAMWFVTSWLVRMAATVGGFVWVGGRQWDRYVIALVGFLLARMILVRTIGQRETGAVSPSL